jgi:hypothetical protein
MITEPLHEKDFNPPVPATGPVQLWVYNKSFSTALGPLQLELNARPDPALLEAAQDLITVVHSKISEIAAALYAQYLDFAEVKHWMKAQGVPLNLAEDQISQYVRSVTAYADRLGDGGIGMGVFIRTKWDPEHGMRFAIREGRLVRSPQ